MPNLNGSTIVPHESMLGGPYIRVNSPDLGAESYDDSDEPFAQHVVYKRETASPAFVKLESESPDNRRRPRRSICETHTGGKMVKKEQRDMKKGKKGQQKVVKSKKSKSPTKNVLIRLDGELVENKMKNVYRDKEVVGARLTRNPRQNFYATIHSRTTRKFQQAKGAVANPSSV